MSFSDFFIEVEHCVQTTGWRYGQALFNTLCDLRPDLSEQIRATNMDPFYLKCRDDNPDKWDKCMNFIKDNWEK